MFEVVQKVREINRERLKKAPNHRFTGKSFNSIELKNNPSLELDYVVACPQMAHYIQVSSKIYSIYLKYISSEDIHVYSIDEVFMDVTTYLNMYKMTAHELAMKMIKDVLKETDEEGKEVDFKDYDSWSYDEETSATYTNKVMESHTLSYSGDAHTTVTKTSEFQTLDSSVQARYITDSLIGIFKDETGLTYDDDDNLVTYETHGLDCAYGQAYSDWWDKTYGKYAAAYVGMNSLEKYDEQCFGDYLSVNDTIANQLAYYGDDYYEDGVAPVTSVEANEAKASLSFSIGGDYEATLSDVAYESGYEGWVDAEIYQNINIDVEFDTPTGVITKFVIGQEYYIKNNPNTGATLETPFVIQTQVSEYSGFETLGEFTGTLKQVGDEFDVRYYDIFYKDAEHYWFFNFSQGVPCPYQVDLTATKLNKAMTDGFSWSNPATYNADGSITLPGAKAHAYTDEEGQSKTIKYTYTFSLDADGNLVSTYVNEKNETVTETYYSSANFAKQ